MAENDALKLDYSAFHKTQAVLRLGGFAQLRPNRVKMRGRWRVISALLTCSEKPAGFTRAFRFVNSTPPV